MIETLKDVRIPEKKMQIFEAAMNSLLVKSLRARGQVAVASK
jgi:hypothetical protein